MARDRLSTRSLGRGALIVGSASAAVLAAASALMHHEAVPHGDDLIYERMAQHPFATHSFPFAYRVAVPTVVHVVPVDHRVAFTVLSILCAGAAAAFLFALIAQLAGSGWFAPALAVLFACSPPILVAVLRNGRSVDPATLLVMCAATLYIVQRKQASLAITLFLGAFVRESTMFLVPFAYAVWAERPIDVSAAKRVAGVALPSVAVYVALRLALPTVGQDQVIGYGGGLVSERIHVLRVALQGGFVELRRVFLAFGPLWLVAPFALRNMSFARRGLVLVALCVVSMTYALDWERVLILAAPVVYPAAAFVMKRSPRLQYGVIAVWLVVIVGYAGYMQHSGVVKNIDHGSPPTYPVQ